MKEVSALALILSLIALIFGLSGIVTPEGENGERLCLYVVGTTNEQTSSTSFTIMPQMELNFTTSRTMNIRVTFGAGVVVQDTSNNTAGNFVLLWYDDLMETWYPVAGCFAGTRNLVGLQMTYATPFLIYACEIPSGNHYWRIQWRLTGSGTLYNFAGSPLAYYRSLVIEEFD